MNNNPKGMGVYLRAINTSPQKLDTTIQRLIACKIKWAAIGSMWHEKGKVRWINKPETIVRITAALNEARIAPYNWGYPWYSTIDQFVRDMEVSLVFQGHHFDTLVTRGFLLDPELGLRKRHAEAKVLFQETRNIADKYEGFTIGFTSYGVIVPDFPWDEYAEPGLSDPTVECDYGSPQLYEGTPEQIINGLAAYKKLGFDEIIPSFGLYVTYQENDKRAWRSKTPTELRKHYDTFVKAKPKFNAMIGWAENFIKPNLVPIIAEYSELLDRGIFALK